MRPLVVALVCMMAVAAVADKQPFDRYQSVVERQMFGPLPAGFDPTKLPSEVSKTATTEKELTQEQEKLQSSIQFSVINVTPDGATAVGFTDNSDPKAPIHYYLKVGEKRNGWEVKAADPVTATMTIAKEDIEVSLTLGGNSAKSAGSTARAGSGIARPAMVPSALGNTLRSRRLQRRKLEEELQVKESKAAEEKEAARKAKEEEERAQREQERAEQRQQLMAIQEELKRVREAKAAEKTDKSEGESGEQN